MKLALNGALTIGTHDGANDEIADAVGSENTFLFGRNYDQTQQFRADYKPERIYETIPALKRALDMISGGYFSSGDHAVFAPVFNSLVRNGDQFLVLADYESYVQRQAEVDKAFLDGHAWSRKAIRNTANVGYFSIDRAVREYAKSVWNTQPLTAFGGVGPG